MAQQSPHEGMRDEHANLHAHHLAASELHEKGGQPGLATLHHRMAGHHLKLAEHHDAMATAPTAAAQPTKAAPAPKGADTLAMGAATQLHRKGHIDAKTHARIQRAARSPRPFGSLGGAGHLMGDVDTENSAGTNSVA